MNYNKKARIAPVVMAAVMLLGVAADFDMSKPQAGSNIDVAGTVEAGNKEAADDSTALAGAKSTYGLNQASQNDAEPNAGIEEIEGGDVQLELSSDPNLERMPSEAPTPELTPSAAPTPTPSATPTPTATPEPTATPTPTEEPAPKFYSEGVVHSSVADIQQRLMDLGFMDYSEPTDYYGSITVQAVKLFQRQNELKQDGIIGPETLEMLLSEDAKTYLAKQGMRGDDIKRIQQRLYEMGYLAKEEYVTGYFGDVTESAVKELQKNNGLDADGKVGSMTMEMLYSENAKANLLAYGDESEVVLACQERLKELGYLTTKPDGEYGNDTVAAVKLFQSRNDLVVDGFLGPSTMMVLYQSNAVPNGLIIGDSGDTVKRVQELLAKYGYMSSSSNTGYFGEVTEAAVKAFQKNNGLSVDGNVGQKTMAKLTSGSVIKASGSSSSSSDSSSSGNSGSSGSSSSGSSSGSSSSSSSDSSTGSVSALLKVAKSKVGKPYVYGAKGPNSFDCSGYVYWCLNQVGVRQSYITSYGWRTVGKYQKITKFSEIQAGDIVVVYGHVGIAAGNGMIYDASSSNGKIVYRELGSWWKKNFIVAWRIF